MRNSISVIKSGILHMSITEMRNLVARLNKEQLAEAKAEVEAYPLVGRKMSEPKRAALYIINEALEA